jgi:hypothetical protein
MMMVSATPSCSGPYDDGENEEWSSSMAAVEDATSLNDFEFDGDNGESILSDGAVKNEEGKKAGWFASVFSGGPAVPKWEMKTTTVYKGTYAYKVMMTDRLQYRNEQKPIQGWHRDDGTRWFRFAFAPGDTFEPPTTGRIFITQWWQQSPYSPPVSIVFGSDRKPCLAVKNDYGSATPDKPNQPNVWCDSAQANGSWRDYIVEIRWKASGGTLKLWKKESGSYNLKFDMSSDCAKWYGCQVGFHDSGVDQTNYTWKIGGYRARPDEDGSGGDTAKYVMYYDEMKYANTWTRINENK